MATLVFTAIGSALGGPLGGAIGGLIGQQIDSSLLGGQQGPRLNDLKVTISSYGSTIAQHHGIVRAPGTIIWATDLVERSETQGGGKGAPAATTYSYSVSFAVALASRPILDVRRIWADGNLLRGTEGDLKVGGMLRIYTGHGDHDSDPLIAAAQGSHACAFRGTAYAVFEDLDLTTFGNRIPALTFELVADEGTISLDSVLSCSAAPWETSLTLPRVTGFSYEGGPLVSTLSTIDSVYPLALDSGGERLALRAADLVPQQPASLSEAAAADDDESFGRRDGRHARRRASDQDVPTALRYYDVARDYLTGLQRADGQARPGRDRTIDFPGSMAAQDARALANAAAERAGRARETMAWRTVELDPAIAPGSIVRIPGKSGNWRVTSWEWRENGVELELLRLPRGVARDPDGDAGTALTAPDNPNGATVLQAFELPWSGSGSSGAREVFAAASSAASGWTGAALFADQAGTMVPLGSTRHRAVMGTSATSIGPSPSLVLERQATLDVSLAAPDLALISATAEALASGVNRALLGKELLQFAQATALGAGLWRLSGLLRGRGGTEAAAAGGHPAGSVFVLLDGPIARLDPARLPAGAWQIAASGLADAAPVLSAIVNGGLTLKPLTPVHPRTVSTAGGLSLGWKRRARGSWNWPDEVDAPLVEDKESYLVGVGPVAAPPVSWTVNEPRLLLDTMTYSSISAAYPGQSLWVRQNGTWAMSDPLLLHVLP